MMKALALALALVGCAVPNDMPPPEETQRLAAFVWTQLGRADTPPGILWIDSDPECPKGGWVQIDECWLGSYTHGDDFVRVAVTADGPLLRTTVHEFVHVLQWRSGVPGDHVLPMFANESALAGPAAEAYAAVKAAGFRGVIQ